MGDECARDQLLLDGAIGCRQRACALEAIQYTATPRDLVAIMRERELDLANILVALTSAGRRAELERALDQVPTEMLERALKLRER